VNAAFVGIFNAGQQSASWKERPSAIIVVVFPVVAGPEMIRRAVRPPAGGG
jgi:hypothetical protein